MTLPDGIIYYRIFGMPLLLYMGILALLSLFITAMIAFRKVTRTSVRWHHWMAFLSIGLALVHGTLGILGEFGSGGSRIAGYSEEARNYSGPAYGKQIFESNCSGCHPDGGNVVYPDMPIEGSGRLSDFQTFHRFIRDPRMPDGSTGPMPLFSEKQLSDEQVKELYRYIISEGGLKNKQ